MKTGIKIAIVAGIGSSQDRRTSAQAFGSRRRQVHSVQNDGPILEELEQEYAGRMEVEFIDVREESEAGKEYGVEMIPTQIFCDTRGQEPVTAQGILCERGHPAIGSAKGSALQGLLPKVPPDLWIRIFIYFEVKPGSSLDRHQ